MPWVSIFSRVKKIILILTESSEAVDKEELDGGIRRKDNPTANTRSSVGRRGTKSSGLSQLDKEEMNGLPSERSETLLNSTVSPLRGVALSKKKRQSSAQLPWYYLLRYSSHNKSPTSTHVFVSAIRISMCSAKCPRQPAKVSINFLLCNPWVTFRVSSFTDSSNYKAH